MTPSRSEAGNEYILMMVESFMNWTECVPLPSQILYICIVWVPFRNFYGSGKKFGKICSLLQIHKLRTTPYRPSGNGQVELYNCTLINAVLCYIDNQSNLGTGIWVSKRCIVVCGK